MTKPNVLITRADFPEEGMQILKQVCDVTIYDQEKPIPKNVLLNMISEKDALLCMLTDRIDSDVIEKSTDLKVVSTMSIGYEHIDINMCKKKNIAVCNSPLKSASDAVAEWAILLMIASGRFLMKSVTDVSKGKWIHSADPFWLCGNGLTDAVIGIVGMGTIGLKILNRILPFEVKEVYYYESYYPVMEAEEKGAKYAELQELMKISDYVVSTLQLTWETKNIFCKETFNYMKTSAIFINIGSNGVVNQQDLYEVLLKKCIGGAALDFASYQDFAKDDSLLSLDNIIITPCLATATFLVRRQMAEIAAQNILNVLQGTEALSMIVKSSARKIKSTISSKKQEIELVKPTISLEKQEIELAKPEISPEKPEIVEVVKSEIEIVKPEGQETEIVKPEGQETEIVKLEGQQIEIIMPEEQTTEIVKPEGQETEIVKLEQETKIVKLEQETKIVKLEQETKIVKQEQETKIVKPEGQQIEITMPEEQEIEITMPEEQEIEITMPEEQEIENVKAVVSSEVQEVEIVVTEIASENQEIEAVKLEISFDNIKIIELDMVKSEMEIVKLENQDIEAVKPERSEIEIVNPESPEIEIVQPENQDIEAVKPESPEIEIVKPENQDIEAVKPESPEIEIVNLETETEKLESDANKSEVENETTKEN